MLVDASNVTGMPADTVAGEVVNAAVGAPAAGRITPSGTRRISTCSGFSVAMFEPVAVATIATQLPGSELHEPNTPLGGAGGAVYTTEATPSLPVTTVRAE